MNEYVVILLFFEDELKRGSGDDVDRIEAKARCYEVL